jgi:glycosyltransferase involved in cell wall biosynthesis
MRVGIDGRAFQPGFKTHVGRGIGLYAAELLQALVRLGEAEIVLYLDPRLPVAEARVPAGVTRAWYPRAPLRLPAHALFSTEWLVAPAVASARVDVFHFLTHLDAPTRLPRHAVATVHDLIPLLLRGLYERERPLRYRVQRALERRVLARARLLLADSERTRRDLERLLGIDATRVRVAPLGVSARFRPPPAAEIAAVRARRGLERPYLLYVGGIDPRKNVPGLLEAYGRLRAAHPGAPDLVLAGAVERDPHLPALRAQAHRLRLGDAFRVLGFVPDQELPALLAGALAFVFPSSYEGFGLPPLEAMACGTSVVATAAGSLPEVLGDAALLVPPDDGDALAAALARITGDEALRAALRARGLERAAGFTWARTARATLAAYHEARDLTRRAAP